MDPNLDQDQDLTMQDGGQDRDTYVHYQDRDVTFQNHGLETLKAILENGLETLKTVSNAHCLSQD